MLDFVPRHVENLQRFLLSEAIGQCSYSHILHVVAACVKLFDPQLAHSLRDDIHAVVLQAAVLKLDDFERRAAFQKAIRQRYGAARAKTVRAEVQLNDWLRLYNVEQKKQHLRHIRVRLYL